MSKEFIKGSNEAWESVEIARHKERPTGQYYIENIFKDLLNCMETDLLEMIRLSLVV